MEAKVAGGPRGAGGPGGRLIAKVEVKVAAAAAEGKDIGAGAANGWLIANTEVKVGGAAETGTGAGKAKGLTAKVEVEAMAA